MSLLNSKDKVISDAVPKQQKRVRHQVVELLGREFRVVKHGLDPYEVLAFLETIAGSSEAVLKRLEHFSNVQRMSNAMEAMIAETKQLVEHTKAQAKLEAERDKSQANEEAKRQIGEMLDQAKKSCIASIEGTYSILLEAITKAKAIEDMALQKTKELVSTNMQMIQQDVSNTVEATYRDLNSSFNQSTEEPSPSPIQAVTPPPDDKAQEKVQEKAQAEERVFDLTGLHESEKVRAWVLENKPTDPKLEQEKEPSNIEAHAITPEGDNQPTDPKLEQEKEPSTIEAHAITPEGDNQPTDPKPEQEKEPVNIEAHATTPEEDNQPTDPKLEQEKEPVNIEARATTPEEDNYRLHSGQVILKIPQRAGQLWMRQLQQRLLSVPGVDILLESGGDMGETMVTLSLDKPVALSSVLLEIPNVKRVIDSLNGEKSPEGLAQTQNDSVPENSQRTTLMIVLNEDTIE